MENLKTTNSECLIHATRRKRVAGSGPKRNQLVEYGVVDSNVPAAVIEEIINISSVYRENDLRGDNYQISQHCNVDHVFTDAKEYRQILLQYLDKHATDEVDETNYTDWQDMGCSNIKKYLESIYIKPYRTRISIIPPGYELNWHIDTDTSVLCRVQIPAVKTNSKFQWKTKTNFVETEMNPSCAYFVNTGWTHRVVNNSNDVRINLIFGVEYSNLPNKEILLK